MLKIDNETGDTVEFIDLGGSVNGVERDSDGYVYVMVGQYLRKYTPDLTEQLWETPEETYGYYTVKIGPGEEDVYCGGNSWVARVDAETGEIIWHSSIAEDRTYDMSFDEEYLYIHYDSEYEQQQVDPESGNVLDEVMMSGYNNDTIGIVVHDGWYYSTRPFARMHRSDDFSRGDSFNDDEFDVDNDTHLEINSDGFYTAGSGKVAHLDFDGNTLWQVEFEPSERLWSLDTSPDTIWMVSDDTMYCVDPENGDIRWENNDVTFDDNYIRYDIGGFPSLDMIGEENYFLTTEISGTVELNGDPVDGAEILLIDDDSSELATRVETNTDGTWSATVPDRTIHAVAQYTDENGDVYNSESYPYVNSG
ncbi:hypothetical protein [Natronoglomus mannanivorans]|uniref:PQQ-like beta-propeller repeat protein n=1 Tax=Natronoglomus mannanivorans TaxID=2979990 RepID=A0AAP2Z3H4_9EURY|nr:PQQ-like beta-propeller repeat protein [Halobacteria archaeon AArc-xg1-1]